MNPLVQPDPGLFIWTIVTFLVLLTFLAKFAWKPLLEALETRQNAIRKSLDDAQQEFLVVREHFLQRVNALRLSSHSCVDAEGSQKKVRSNQSTNEDVNGRSHRRHGPCCPSGSSGAAASCHRRCPGP